MILIIDNYDSFTYNLVQAFGEMGAEPIAARNDELTLGDIAHLRPQGIVISPGPGTPERAGISLETIQHFAGKIPILGVCLGHQAIGQAFGGRVVRAPYLMHGKTSEISHDGKTIFQGIPSPFTATRYHSLIVDLDSLPPDLEVSADTDDQIVMGLRHRRLMCEGVQFHPESILTFAGKKLLANFLAMTAQR